MENDELWLTDYYTRKQLAAAFHVSPRTIKAWEKDGLLVIKVGRQRLYAISDVREWLRAHKEHHSEEGNQP